MNEVVWLLTWPTSKRTRTTNLNAAKVDNQKREEDKERERVSGRKTRETRQSADNY